MTRLVVHHEDPSGALTAAFARIERERMAGVALLNPALRVEAVDFARWQGHWLGALVTPWFLNLVLVPGEASDWDSIADGARAFRHFAAGDFAFLGSHEPEVGEFQTCSLFSPMERFADQASAVATARAALRMLHVQPRPADQAPERLRCSAPPVATVDEDVPARRVFLLGRGGPPRAAGG